MKDRRPSANPWQLLAGKKIDDAVAAEGAVEDDRAGGFFGNTANDCGTDGGSMTLHDFQGFSAASAATNATSRPSLAT